VAAKAAGRIHSADFGPCPNADPGRNNRRRPRKIRFHVIANTSIVQAALQCAELALIEGDVARAPIHPSDRRGSLVLESIRSGLPNQNQNVASLTLLSGNSSCCVHRRNLSSVRLDRRVPEYPDVPYPGRTSSALPILTM
jgi:hypothetical protein